MLQVRHDLQIFYIAIATIFIRELHAHLMDTFVQITNK